MGLDNDLVRAIRPAARRSSKTSAASTSSPISRTSRPTPTGRARAGRAANGFTSITTAARATRTTCARRTTAIGAPLSRVGPDRPLAPRRGRFTEEIDHAPRGQVEVHGQAGTQGGPHRRELRERESRRRKPSVAPGPPSTRTTAAARRPAVPDEARRPANRRPTRAAGRAEGLGQPVGRRTLGLGQEGGRHPHGKHRTQPPRLSLRRRRPREV